MSGVFGANLARLEDLYLGPCNPNRERLCQVGNFLDVGGTRNEVMWNQGPLIGTDSSEDSSSGAMLESQ